MAIHPAPALGEADYRRALAVGPRAVSTRRRSYRELLTAAGFEAIEVVDLTDDYRETLDLLSHHQELHAEELGELSGVESFEERQAELREALAAIDEGLLKRSFCVAERGE
jgi:hypothetical protein